LEKNGSGTAQSGQEESLAAEKHGFQVAGPLDIIINAVGESDNAAGIHPQMLIVKLFGDDGATGMDESHAIAAQALKDEAFAAEKTSTHSFGKSNADPSPLR